MPYKYPFLYIGGAGVKLSLLALALYLLIEGLTVLCPRGRWRFSLGEKDKDKRKAFRKLRGPFALYAATLSFALVMRATGDEHFGNLAEQFLKYENIFAVGLLLVFLSGVLFYRQNTNAFIRAMDRVTAGALLICAAFTAASGQIVMREPRNIAVFFSLGVVFAGLCAIEVEAAPGVKNSGQDSGEDSGQDDGHRDYFAPVEEYGQLFQKRKALADQVAEEIASKDVGPRSICINGGWGSGKTSLVNGALQKLGADGSDQFEVLRINAMELDDEKTLISYVFGCIKRMLKKRGAYVGFGSEYQKAVSSMLKTAANATIADVVENTLFPTVDDYREQKKKLERLIAEVMPEGKLILVLDDIERCDADKVKQFIYFTKEIATMDRCVVVFIADYSLLSENIAKLTGEKGDKGKEAFLDKFFHHRFELSDISVEEMLPVIEKQWDYGKNPPYPEFGTLSEVFLQLCQEFDNKCKKAEETDQKHETKRAGELRALKEQFIEELKTPRRLNKLVVSARALRGRIDSAFAESGGDETRAYFRLLRLDELLFILAYITACFPAETEALYSQGRHFFESLWSQKENSRRRLIAELAEGYLMSASVLRTGVEINYMQNKTLQFVHTLLLEPSKLPETVNDFSKQEEEWFAAVDDKNAAAVEKEWEQIVTALIKAPYSVEDHLRAEEAERSEKRLKYMFALGKEKAEAGTWRGNDLLAFLTEDKHIDMFLGDRLCVMRDVYEMIDSEAVLAGISSSAVQTLNELFARLGQTRMLHAVTLLQFYAGGNGYEQERELGVLRNASERMLFTRDTIEGRIESFLSALDRMSAPPRNYKAQTDVFDKLRALADEIESFLGANGMLRFDDVSGELELMRVSTEDLYWMAKIMDRLERRGKAGVWLLEGDDIRKMDIDKCIRSFERALQDPRAFDNEKLRFAYGVMFGRIRDDPELRLTPEQIETLHRIVGEYGKATRQNPIWSRKILMDHENRRAAEPEEQSGVAEEEKP